MTSNFTTANGSFAHPSNISAVVATISAMNATAEKAFLAAHENLTDYLTDHHNETAFLNNHKNVSNYFDEHEDLLMKVERGLDVA